MLYHADATSQISVCHFLILHKGSWFICYSRGGTSAIVSVIKKGLTTGGRWPCYAVVLLSLCRNTPIEMHEGILGFGERPTAVRNWAGLVSGTKKVRLFLSFVIDAAPKLSLDSCGLPPTVLWGWLFLNKWVYDSDFLLPLLSLSLIWNSTHPSERAQSSCCLSPHFTCATWLGRRGGHPSSIWKACGHTHL